MATAAGRGGRKPASIRTLWAIAKSPELNLSDDDLHAVVHRETGKESMRKLTQGEINNLARVLQNMKDSAAQKDTASKRTDTGGDVRTVSLRRKIYALCGVLGWNNDNRRINGFVKRMCGIDRIEWLTMAQCHVIIEALKKMVARQEAQGEESGGVKDGGSREDPGQAEREETSQAARKDAALAARKGVKRSL